LTVNRLIRVSYGPFQLLELEAGEIEEVNTRTLRDQISEKIARAAGVDFDAPVREVVPEPKPERVAPKKPEVASPARPAATPGAMRREKPRGRPRHKPANRRGGPRGSHFGTKKR
jgi:23S rRNA pseudouridine2605 synthase